MLLQFGCHVAANDRLILLLFNQLLRHEAARDVALAVKSNPGKAAEFYRTVNPPAFREELKQARGKSCHSKEVKAILKKIRPFLQLSGKKVRLSMPPVSVVSFSLSLTCMHTHSHANRCPSLMKSGRATLADSTPSPIASALWLPSSR